MPEPIRTSLTKPKSDTVHVLGNGSSLELFVRSDWPDEHFFVGCNFSNESLRPDVTVMMDAKPVMNFYEGYKLKIPLILSDRCEQFIVNDRGGWNRLPAESFVLVDIIPMIHPQRGQKQMYPMNSGHHATMYGIGYNEGVVQNVHLWGFDTFWTNDISSNTDTIVKRISGPRIRPTVADAWREYWVQIFQEHITLNFIIHGNQSLVQTFLNISNIKCNSL